MSAPGAIAYAEHRHGAAPPLEEVVELYVASTLAERRPAEDRERMARMLAGADLLVTAREGERLVGLARSITDWAYCTYLSDLAVRASHQRAGIGRELVARTRAAAPQARVILLAAPAAAAYYPRIGMERHPAAFTWAPLRP